MQDLNAPAFIIQQESPKKHRLRKDRFQ